MARPSEIDAKTVARMRDLNKMPWDAIAVALGASRSGVVTAYRRLKGLAVPVSEQVTALRQALVELRLANGCWCGISIGALCQDEDCVRARYALEMSD